MAAYQKYEIDEMSQDTKYSEEQRRLVSLMTPMAPAEVPLEVIIKNGTVSVLFSQAIADHINDLHAEEAKSMLDKQSADDSGLKSKIFDKNYEKEFDMLQSILEYGFFEWFGPEMFELLKNDAETTNLRRVNAGFIFPFKGFSTALDKMMEEVRPLLEQMSDEYGTPHSVDQALVEHVSHSR